MSMSTAVAPDGLAYGAGPAAGEDMGAPPRGGLRDDDEGFLKYMVYGEQRDETENHPWYEEKASSGFQHADKTVAKYVLRSMDFGQSWNWTLFPEWLQSVNVMAVDPTNASTLYAVAPACLSSSKDQGESWSPCLEAVGLSGSFASLAVKDSQTMILLRGNDVPLRTKDGGSSWHPLQNCANISTPGYTRSGEYSWTGRTLVIHGRDNSAPSRGQRASFVWKTVDDGDTWSDETGDLVTMAVNAGQWFGSDFYLTTSGEGILVKRNFDL